MAKIIHVLLTGGVGSRLWPLSRRSKPKQYLEIFSGKSLFELALSRNLNICDALIVVGNRDNSSLSENLIKKVGIEEYTHLKEATPRNTAAAIAFAAFSAEPEDVLLVTPSDHLIEEDFLYGTAVKDAVKLARQDALVTFGVKPDRAETGYGYLEIKGDVVLSFKEKPDKPTAEHFLNKGNFLWNSGVFCFKASVFLQELEQHMPLLYQKAATAWGAAKDNCLDYHLSSEIPSISVDYAVMEKSRRIKVVKADFKWSDMGSFEAVYDFLKQQGQPVDNFGNMQIGTTKFTSFVGLQNCIFVSTTDADLILSKQASQGVKDLYAQLEKDHLQLIQ